MECASQDELAGCWDDVLAGIEYDILNRHDVPAVLRNQYVGRSGPLKVGWQKVQWAPAKTRIKVTEDEKAWGKGRGMGVAYSPHPRLPLPLLPRLELR